jgi:hypothetical protein
LRPSDSRAGREVGNSAELSGISGIVDDVGSLDASRFTGLPGAMSTDAKEGSLATMDGP